MVSQIRLDGKALHLEQIPEGSNAQWYLVVEDEYYFQIEDVLALLDLFVSLGYRGKPSGG